MDEKIAARRLLVAHGNEMRGDEGAAWELARRASACGWPVLCATRLGSELIDILHGLDEVVFVDVAREPGANELREITPENELAAPAHCREPARLLRLCLQQHGQAPLSWTLTLVGEDFGSHLGLSDLSRSSVARGLEQLNHFFPRHRSA